MKKVKKKSHQSRVWTNHAIDTLFKLSTAHVDGKSLKEWVQHKDMDTMEQFYNWEERYLAKGELPKSYLETPWDKKSLNFCRPIPSKTCLCFGNISIT